MSQARTSAANGTDREAAPIARYEQRAHARSERHRISGELHNVAGLVASGLEPDDVVEPGAAWKPEHHHDPKKAVAQLKKPNRFRHWKQKAWKRRTTVRREKALALQVTEI